MACPNGSKAKSGAPSTWLITNKEVIDVAYGGKRPAIAPLYGIVAGGLTDSLCGAPPEAEFMGSRFPGDVAAAAFNRTVVQKWNELCQCRAAKDPLLTMIGSACSAVLYRWTMTNTYRAYNTGNLQSFGASGEDIGPIQFSTRLIKEDAQTERLWGQRRTPTSFKTQYLGNAARPGSSRITVTFVRADGRSESCGEQEGTGVDIPPSFYFPGDIVLPEIKDKPCSCPPTIQPPAQVTIVRVPTQVLVPTLVPVPIPAPVPVPIPAPFPVPIPVPIPIPIPIPFPVPAPPTPKPPEDDMDCCVELLAAIARLQGDVSAIRDEEIPSIKDRIDVKVDGLVECLDFNLSKFDSIAPLGSGETGTAVLPARAIGVRAIAITPTPANRSKRQSGGGTPDVIQGGWLWWEWQGGISERMPIDADKKLYLLPELLRGKEGVRVYWRGVNDISYSVGVLLSLSKTAPPYEDRPCAS